MCESVRLTGREADWRRWETFGHHVHGRETRPQLGACRETRPQLGYRDGLQQP
jgi:hypothetical protein